MNLTLIEPIPNVLHAFLIAPLVVLALLVILVFLVLLVLHVILVLLGPCDPCAPCVPAGFSNTATAVCFCEYHEFLIQQFIHPIQIEDIHLYFVRMQHDFQKHLRVHLREIARFC